MSTDFQDAKVSIALVCGDDLPYGPNAFGEMVRAALDQDHGHAEVLIVDDRSPGAELPFAPAGLGDVPRLRHLSGAYGGRAAMYNAALQAATGDFFLMVLNGPQQVVLRRSAARAMIMAAVRHGDAGMVYGDYERIDGDGAVREIHLHDWHEGRLRDTVDFGAALLFPTARLREMGGVSATYEAADLYDLRLRISEHHSIVHVANRYAGSLYRVAAPAKAHNVFDYLLSDKAAQLEMERALTEHLKRTGAYLASGAHVRPVKYDAEERQRFDACTASVVIPVNHRPEFIGHAIESVQRQTVRNIEVIVVVNGGDDDPTGDAVRRYLEGGERHDPGAPPVRLIVLDVNNLGVCLNTGLSEARGKYYIQLDSDDRLKPDAVEKIMTVFDSDPTIGMVIGSYEVATLDEETGELIANREIPVVAHHEWTAENGRNNLLRVNGAGAPRAAHIKVIREMGWFGVNDDPSCRNYGEDYDLVNRVAERYTIGRVWEPIYVVVRHAGGTDHCIDQATIDRNDDAKDHMRLAALRRRRRLNGQGG